MQIQFATQAYKSASLPVSAQRCINLYAEKEPADAKTRVAVFGVPGIAAFATAGPGPVRGAHQMGGLAYVVANQQLYRIAADGTATLLGTGISGSGNVAMSDNGAQLCIVNGVSGWIYQPGGLATTLATTALTGATSVTVTNATGITNGDTFTLALDDSTIHSGTITSAAGAVIGVPALPSKASAGAKFIDTASSFTQIVSANFFPANTVSFFDGYFVFDKAGTSEWFISGLFDGLSFSGLDFATGEVNSSNVGATVNQQEMLLIFKLGQSTETWYDAGTLSFPFQRYDGATIERGLVAPQSTVKEDNSVFFLGDDLIYYRLDGTLPVRVSTHAIEQDWGRFATKSDAVAFSYTAGGHKFIVLTFPAAERTFVFDIASGLWHERESWDASNNSLGRWRASCHVYCYGKHLVGDAFSGRVGFLDETVFTEWGNTIRGQAVSPPIHSDRKRVFMSRFELDVETGIGLAAGQGSNPQIMLDWSDDGGRTFKTLQPWRSMGKIGEYLKRLRWLQMGQFRQRVLRVNVTDPVPRVIIAAHADISAGI